MRECPFCGSTKVKVIGFLKEHWVDCPECKTCGPVADCKETAVMVWNEAAR